MPKIQEIVFNDGHWPESRSFESECGREYKDFERVYENAVHEFHTALQAKYEARFNEVITDAGIKPTPEEAEKITNKIQLYVAEEYGYEKGPDEITDALFFEDLLRDVLRVKFVEELEEEDV